MTEAEKMAQARAIGLTIEKFYVEVCKKLNGKFKAQAAEVRALVPSVERLAALEARLNRFEAANEHMMREIKLLRVITKTTPGKFEAATKALADVRAKSKAKAKGNGKSRAKAAPVVSLTDAAIASAQRKSKTTRAYSA